MSDVEKNIGTHKPQFDGEWVPISQVYDLQMGKTPSRDIPEYWNNGEHDWVSIKDLGSYEKYVGKTSETISELGRVKSGIKSVPANTLLMSFKLSLGKTAITTKETYTNEAIMAFLDKGTYDVDIDYMWHQLQSKDWTVGTNTAVMGKTLNKKTLSATKIRVPSISEQKEIAKHLDVVQETLSLLSLELKTLDDLVKSQFVEMFGDPIYNEKGYPEKRLGELLEIARGGSPRPIKDYLTNDPEGINWIKIGDTVEGSRYINSTAEKIKPEGKAKSREVKAGDFLLSNSMSFGRPYILNIDGCIHDGWLVLSDSRKRFNKVFLCELLGSSALKAKFSSSVRGGVVNNLNIDLVASTVVPYPPLALQQQFADFVARVDKLGFDVQQQIEKLETLKQSLMQEYFG